MNERVIAALSSLHTRVGFAMLAFDELMVAIRSETETPIKHHPDCVAAMCGKMDCGRPGPCYVKIQAGT